MPAELILLVDDEPNIVQLGRMYLEREGYRVLSAGDGQAALQSVEQHAPDLLVLDLMLPGLDGWEVCRRLQARRAAPAILMLTARDDDVDKIVGLELGADDYMTKPFNPRELVARVKAILRRGERKASASAASVLRIADLEIDPGRREVRVQGAAVELRTQEFDLLHVLAAHHGLVLSREKLLELAWGFDFYGQTRTVDVHVGHLRKKLSASRAQIETVTGVGYKLVG